MKHLQRFTLLTVVAVLTSPWTMAGEIGTAVFHSRPAKEAKAAPRATTEYTGHGNPTDQEQYLLELVNRARANPTAESQLYGTPNDKSAAPPLAMNGILLGAARAHSKDMHDQGYFSHTGLDGRSPFDRMQDAGYNYSSAAENIAAGYGTVEATHKGWLGSSGHRSNIYHSGVTEIGPGIYWGTKGYRDYFTEKFGKQSGSGPRKFVLGVAYNDQNGNNFYDPGEGLSGVRVEFTVGGDTVFTTTGSAGGYALPYSADTTFDVTASGGALGGTVTKSVTTSGVNVKQDFLASEAGGGTGGPTITSALTASGTAGENFSYTITATGTAPISYSSTTLPAGLTLSGDTISGIPSVDGQFTVTISATNGQGNDSKSLVITIDPEVFVSNSTVDTDGDGFVDEIEDGLGTSSTNAGDTPFNDQPAGTPETLDVLKARIKINFAIAGKDLILVQGTLAVPAGFSVAGAQVTVDVGGVVKTFTLDEKGRSPRANDTFKIKIKAKKGVVEAQVSKFVLKCKLGDFDTQLHDEGLRGHSTVKKAARSVPIIVLWNGKVYQVTRGMLYTAKAQKKGSAK